YLISLVSFLLGIFDAFWIYTLSAYFAKVSGTDNIGIFYVTAFTGALISLFYIQPLINRIGRARMLYFSLGIGILLSVLLTHVFAGWLSILIVIGFLVANNIIWVALDVLLEAFSSDGMAGRIRGLHLTIVNAGFLIAPFLASKVLSQYQFEGIFFVLSLGYMLVFLIALVGFRNDNVVFHEGLKPLQTIRKMMRERNLLNIYFISFAMDFFYALMVVYTSLYLLELGFSWNDLGIIFTIMLVPFVLLQYPLGRLADKRLGEKELLIVSIMIVIFSTGVLPFIHSHSIWVWGIALFMTRVGIAGIEVLRDAYFYKQIDGNDSDIIAFFRTSRPVANIVGAGIAAFVLVLWSLKSIFFVIVFVMILALIVAIFLEDTESEREIHSH
ncbi:MAG: MFS transporter, partial [Candidatus Moraniibacteriota bacterium]